MATGAKIGKKTQFLREDTVGGGTYTQVAEVKSIGGPAKSRDAVEATSMDSADDHAEYIPGIAEGGDVSLVLNFRPEHATHGTTSGLAKDYDDGTTRSWQIKWPQFSEGSPPTATFSGFLTGHEITSATRDLVTVAVKLKVTGKVTLTNFA